jgi:hypothetical protein
MTVASMKLAESGRQAETPCTSDTTELTTRSLYPLMFCIRAFQSILVP